MKIAGFLMIFALFSGLFGWIAWEDGLIIALKVFASVAAILFWVYVAAYLISEGK